MRGRRGLILLGLCGLGLLSWWLWPGEDPYNPSLPPIPAPQHSDQLVRTFRRALTEVMKEVKANRAEKPELTDALVTIKGRVRLRDRDGTVREDVQGEVDVDTLEMESEGGLTFSTPKTVQIENGRFEVRRKRGAQVVISRLQIDAEETPLEQRWFDLAEGPVTEIQLEAYRLAKVPLQVIAADTGEHLKDIDVRGSNRMPGPGRHLAGIGSSTRERPWTLGGDKIVVQDAASPLDVPPVPETQDHKGRRWVHAPGYTWERVVFDHHKGTPARVELRPAGSLQLRSRIGRRLREEVDYVLRVYPLDSAQPGPEPRSGEPLFELRLEKPRIWTFLHVPTGHYEAQLLLRVEPETPVLVVRGHASVMKGERSVVQLEVPPPAAEQQLVQLRGKLHYSRKWPREKLRMFFRPIEPGPDLGRLPRRVEPVQHAPDLWHWDAGRIAPGRYEVQLEPFDCSVSVHVPPQGRRDLELRLPDPVPVEIQPEYEEGEDGDTIAVRWRLLETDPHTFHGIFEEHIERVDGKLSCLLPRGPIHLELFDEFMQRSRTQALQIAAPEMRLDIELETIHGALLCLFDLEAVKAGEQPEMPGFLDLVRFKAQVEALDGAGSLRSQEIVGFVYLLLEFDRPGRYRVQLPKLEGFAQPAPLTLNIEPFELLEITTPLERSPR